MARRRLAEPSPRVLAGFTTARQKPYLTCGFTVELWGIEPQTSSMPWKRSTN